MKRKGPVVLMQMSMASKAEFFAQSREAMVFHRSDNRLVIRLTEKVRDVLERDAGF